MTVLLVLPAATSAAAPAKNVLILRGGAPNLPAGIMVIDQVEETIRRDYPGPVEFYIETIDTARFSAENYDQRLADLYAETYGRIKLDLVVAFAGPAVDFVRRHRATLFPNAPLLLGLVEPRFFKPGALPADASIVYAQIDPASTMRFALRAYPVARHVVVVVGTSDLDRAWQPIVAQELRPFEQQVTVTFSGDLPLDQLLRNVGSLAPDNIVLYVTLTRDGAGYPANSAQVSQLLSDVSPVPVFGLASTYLGHGIVGGTLLDVEKHSADIGREAVRLLAGGTPRAITTPPTTAVDWRELQRFKIPLSSLPPGTVITHRQDTLWERYKWSILSVLLIVLAQSALIVALVRANKRRGEVQRLLENRLHFERLASDLSLRLTGAGPYEIELALDAALARLAAGIGVDKVWRWEFGAADDHGWESAALLAGHPAQFTSPAELPPRIRHEAVSAGCDRCCAVAVPLTGERIAPGAIFWVSRQPLAAWLARPAELETVSTVVGNVLQRRIAERALAESDSLKGAILDSLYAHVVVLDRDGTIIAVNDAWTKYGMSNGASSESAIGPGVNYLDACVAGIRAGDPGAEEAVKLIHAACRGERTSERLEYRCDAPRGERWFAMAAEPLRRAEGGAVVTHRDITQRKLHEIALRESEGRFRRLADALPVAVWMSDVDARCTYFNKQWLDMTGRTLDQEIGEGWLEGIHPEERGPSFTRYLTAFHARERFTMEYRIRHHDGVYRWLMDIGIPRYGTDGEFHGYVGGCIDINSRIEAEKLLRDLNRRLLAAQEEERRRIARELHDHLNQQLALLAIDLQQLSMNPPAPDALADALQQQWRRTADIASDVHAISHRLHPSKLEALGLVATVRAHCRDVSRQDIAVHFTERGVPAGIPMDIALCLYRVLQEALTNVSKHSGVKEAEVTLVGSDEGLTLRVADAGRGFARNGRRLAGLGLVSMRERLQSLGGTLSITSAPGKGTAVEAHISLAAVAAARQEVEARG